MTLFWVFFAHFCVIGGGLQVYLAPHSHCDAGWLITFEQYYTQRVRNILNSVVDELWTHNDAVFNWAESGFLHRWTLDEMGGRAENRIGKLRTLIAQGRVDFAGGGWVQHDELVCHYRSQINQMTEGHLFLADTFGAVPKFGWQIDPFGASQATPILFGLMGFKATITDRVNLFTLIERIETKQTEYLWTPPAPWSAIPETTVWAHQLGLSLYATPGYVGTFWGKGGVNPLDLGLYRAGLHGIQDARSLDYRTEETGALLLPWGEDFAFQNASFDFSNMRAVLNTTSFANTKFQTIGAYLDRVMNMNLTWPKYNGDWVPYLDVPNNWWTGFYSSRAALKAGIRSLDSLVEAADSMCTFARIQQRLSSCSNISAARQYSGILQHHDAVTGTAREDVVQNYFEMISNGTQLALRVLCESASALLGGMAAVATEPSVKTPNLLIAATAVPLSVVRVPLGAPVTLPSLENCQQDASWLWVQCNVSAFSLTPCPIGKCVRASSQQYSLGPFNASAGSLTLVFDENQRLVALVNGTTSTRKLKHTIGRYWSEFGSAYLMRTDDVTLRIPWGTWRSRIETGPFVTEVTQTLTGSTNLTVIYRLFAHDSRFIEVEHAVEIVDIGYDYISRFDSDVASSGGSFSTDDSGLVIMSHTYNATGTIQSNYRPQTEIAMLFGSAGDRFSVATSQSHGCTSREAGSLEFMIFRRLLFHGFPTKGMGQVLNDTTPLVGDIMHLFIGPNDQQLVDTHRVALNNVPIPLFSSSVGGTFAAASVPEYPIAVLSFKSRNQPFPNATMLRLQNLSMENPATVDLFQLFGLGHSATTFREMSLSFNQPWGSFFKTATTTTTNNNNNNSNNAVVTIEPGMIRSYQIQ